MLNVKIAKPTFSTRRDAIRTMAWACAICHLFENLLPAASYSRCISDLKVPIIWRKATILGDSTVVPAVVPTRPRAIPLAMITMRKSIHGFPLWVWGSAWRRAAELHCESQAQSSSHPFTGKSEQNIITSQPLSLESTREYGVTSSIGSWRCALW